MSLLSKISKKNKQEFIKGDIKIYIQCVNNSTDPNKDSYIMAGIFNEDGTAFKDVLTGEIVRNIKLNDVSICVEEKYYEKLDDAAHLECEDGIRGLVDVHVMRYAKGCKFKQEFIEGRILDRKYVNLEYEKGMNYILEFLLKDENERVSLEDINKVSKVLNKIVYKNHKVMCGNLQDSVCNQDLRSSYKSF